MSSDTVLLTGAAGFIGFHLARRLLIDGYRVVGIDNLNDYYDPQLKRDRIAQIKHETHFELHIQDIADAKAMTKCVRAVKPKYIVHLAAQAGVRYSITNPQSYVASNLVGFVNILEAARHQPPCHFIYASSSSVYGANARIPFSVSDKVDYPLSLYAATKKSNELLAHSYSHLYQLPCSGLRFFTVYGPWGRPDMAIYRFADAIMNGEPIELFNYGDMRRDFTFIDDVIESIVRLMPIAPRPNDSQSHDLLNPASSSLAPYRIYNIGNSHPVHLSYLVETLEKRLGASAVKRLLPMQPGDVPQTYADVKDLEQTIDFVPRVQIEEGIAHFADWYREYSVNKRTGRTFWPLNIDHTYVSSRG